MSIEGLGNPTPPEGFNTEPTGPSEEELHHPYVLQSIALDIIERHGVAEGRFKIAPRTNPYGGADYRVGYIRDNPDLIETVFVYSPLGSEPLYTLTKDSIEHIDDRTVDDLTERKQIRGILAKIGTRLDESVVKELDQFNMDDYLNEQIAGEIAQLKDRLHYLESLAMDPLLPTTVRVDLNSLWANDGEQNLSTSYDSSIPTTDMLRAAAANFKVVNHRSDMQADPHYTVSRGLASYTVPDEVWRPFYQMISRPDGGYEAEALRRVMSQRSKQSEE